MQMRYKICPFKPYCLKTIQTYNIENGIEKLSDDCCPGGALHAPLTYKNKNRIKNHIGNTANQHACHTGLGPSVRPDDIAKAYPDHKDRKTKK